MKLTQVAAVTDPGRVRRRNEDAFVCEPPLFAVADGMGGAQAGEVASRLAAAAFREYRGADALSAEARLRAIIEEANRRIYARASSDPHASGMGTTVTAALVTGSEVAVGHVGDSRCYLLRGGALAQLTEDHSFVADLVRSGRLTPEEAEIHPQRSVITRALGTDPAVAVDTFTVEARPGDVFLLCSDGLTSMVDEEAVLQAIREQPTLEAAARALIDAANRAGGEDNITVVLFALEESGPDEDTLSGLEGVQLPAQATADTQTREAANGAGPEPAVADVPRRPIRERRPRRRLAARVLLIAGGLALALAALAAAALFGLSKAHFVGATSDGHVAVYQGLPWNLIGGAKLYREVYVSNLLAEQLTPQERRRLFDHDLMSEAAARARVAVYEHQAAP